METLKDLKADLPYYRSHKLVQAAQIEKVDGPFSDGSYEVRIKFDEVDGVKIKSITVDGSIFSRYVPKENDFMMLYTDGYVSVSPWDQFVEGYSGI